MTEEPHYTNILGTSFTVPAYDGEISERFSFQPFTTSVSFELGPQSIELVSLLVGMPIDEVSQLMDKHIERGTE